MLVLEILAFQHRRLGRINGLEMERNVFGLVSVWANVLRVKFVSFYRSGFSLKKELFQLELESGLKIFFFA